MMAGWDWYHIANQHCYFMKHQTMKRLCFLALMLSGICVPARAQDTVHIRLQDAESLFYKKNLAVLAGRYNIDIARAQLIQAKLFSNPVLSLNGNLYNPERRKFIDAGNKTGQYDIALQQLIRLAGKRNKEIRMAETAVTLNEQQFGELLRTLRYSLRSEFYSMYSLRNAVRAYDSLIVSLEAMDHSYDQLLAKGVVSLKDAVRIRALLNSVRMDQANLVNQLNESESAFRLLLQDNQTYFVAETDAPLTFSLSIPLQALLDTAYANRNDLRAAHTGLLLSKQNYTLQRALAKPDMTLGAEFDKRGSFVDNASFLTVAFDLPFFNRNQGNIRAARISIKQEELNTELVKQTVESDVQKAYVRFLNAQKLLQQTDPAFMQQFERLLGGVTDNFRKKNISLVEFTDFYQSYKDNVLQYNQWQLEVRQAAEELNFAVGKTIL